MWAFVWAVRGGQYDDLDSPAIDILRDDPADPAGPAPMDEPPRKQDAD
jgi:cbb3-type cytochrome oxidase maturation protein